MNIIIDLQKMCHKLNKNGIYNNNAKLNKNAKNMMIHLAKYE